MTWRWPPHDVTLPSTKVKPKTASIFYNRSQESVSSEGSDNSISRKIRLDKVGATKVVLWSFNKPTRRWTAYECCYRRTPMCHGDQRAKVGITSRLLSTRFRGIRRMLTQMTRNFFSAKTVFQRFSQRKRNNFREHLKSLSKGETKTGRIENWRGPD